MIRLLVTSALLISSASTYACEQNEAQFIGTAKNVQNCTYQIEFRYFNPSGVCPLDIEDAYLQDFKSCDVKNGDEVSGILLQKDDEVSVE